MFKRSELEAATEEILSTEGIRYQASDSCAISWRKKSKSGSVENMHRRLWEASSTPRDLGKLNAAEASERPPTVAFFWQCRPKRH